MNAFKQHFHNLRQQAMFHDKCVQHTSWSTLSSLPYSLSLC